ncbi:hypothetical protein ACEQ8H_004586 [Pleosporales sp. CAS-2024a]
MTSVVLIDSFFTSTIIIIIIIISMSAALVFAKDQSDCKGDGWRCDMPNCWVLHCVNGHWTNVGKRCIKGCSEKAPPQCD